MNKTCCCTDDGGRPSEVGLRKQASNYAELLRPKAVVVSVGEKVPSRHQVWIRKTNASEPLMTCREAIHLTSKPSSVVGSGEALAKAVYDQCGVRHGGGVSLVQASVWNVGTWRSDVKGEVRMGSPQKGESTEAEPRDGTARSSNEAPEKVWSEGAVSISQSQRPTSDGRSL